MTIAPKRKRFNLYLSFSALAFCQASLISPVVAQLNEIVVTAEKRASTLQDTAISISAYGAADLEANVIDNTIDLQYKTPGLSVGTQGNNAFVFLRGVGTSVVNAGTDPSVAVYVDGIYRPRQRDALVEFLDVNRVEILKGPQGTLYGRNATGGAMNVINNRPDLDDFEVSGALTIGNLDLVKINAVTNIPLSDKLALRFAAQDSSREGYTTNLEPSGPAKLDSRDTTNIRAQLLYEASSSFDILFAAEYYEEDRNSVSSQPVASDCGPLFVPVDFTVAPCNQLEAAGIVPVETTDARIASSNAGPQTSSFQSYSTEFNWYPSDAWSVNSKTAYVESKTSTVTDGDGTGFEFQRIEVGGSPTSDEEESETIFHETVANFDNGGDWSATIGVSYFKEDIFQPVSIDVGAILPFSLTPDSTFTVYDFGLTRSDAKLEAEAAGIFSQVTYSVTDRLRLTGGLRYSWEEKAFRTDVETFGFVPGGPPTFESPFFAFSDSTSRIDFAEDSETWTATTGLARIEFDLNDDTLLYLSANRGFKSGAFNTTPAARDEGPLDPEILWSYEAGLKTTLLDGNLRFNGSVFYYDYEDIQVPIFPPENIGVSTIENAAGAEVYGIDGNITALLPGNLTANLAFEVIDSEYQDYLSVEPFTVDPITNTATVVDLSGNQLVSAPDVSIGFGLEHVWDLNNIGTINSSVNWTYKSDHYFTAFAREFEKQEAYDIVNARVGWTDPSGRIGLDLWVKNAADEDIQLNVISQAPNGIAQSFFNEPRTYGLTLRMSN